VALAWKFVDRIEKAWSEDTNDPIEYSAGSWGPEEALQLLRNDGFKWWPINGQDEGEVTWVTNQPK
jgi:glucose-6-phosphate 1-dehydrogenase